MCPCHSVDVTPVTKARVPQVTKGTHRAYTGRGKIQRFFELVWDQLLDEDRNATGFTSSGVNMNVNMPNI